MQNGSITRSTRSHGPDVWEFRWREAGSDGKRKHRRMVIGSIARFSDKSSALLEVTALRRQINLNDPRLSLQPVTVSELVNHYRQRGLATDQTWKTYSTKVTYKGYLNKWILPRWKDHALSAINAGEVELWLRSLPLARATCAKIRNLMSVVFNHGIRHQICSSNPIRLVRQSAKRRRIVSLRIPVVLSVTEVQQLLGALSFRERTLVLLDVGTGLRMSELFGLKWKDVDFDTNEINVVRSIVMQVTGPCKTESSQKPIPLDPYLAEALWAWRQHATYRGPEDWVFANPRMKGRKPYWGQEIMRKVIRPIAVRAGITKHIGWHTFRHIYSTLLRLTRVDIKVMQELLRHASSRVTMDTYTQAVTAQKRKAQSGVIRLFRVHAMTSPTEA
jgi:integrase